MSAADSTRRAGRPPQPTPAGERWRELITPEGVDLRLRLGDASERAAAFFLDVAIMIGVLIAFSLLAAAIGVAVGEGTGEFIAAIWLLGAFALRNFYFMYFEMGPRAATPGKRVVGLRVATRDGAALTSTAIFARNAMRELEIFIPLSFLLGGEEGGWANLAGIIWCAVFAFFPLFNRDRLRVGDFVAGTWVVRAPRRTLERDLARRGEEVAPGFTFTDAEANAYGIKELGVLEEVLRRRDPETMIAVAARIRTKIKRHRAPGEADPDFLEAYYLALRKRLEGRLLFGHRRRDKHDVP